MPPAVSTRRHHVSLDPTANPFDSETLSAPPAGIPIEARGDFNSDGLPDYVGRDANANMSMWEYNPTQQIVSLTNFGPVGFFWTVLAGGSATRGFWEPYLFNVTNSQMLVKGADSTMALWWVSNGTLQGANYGYAFNNIAYIDADAKYTDLGQNKSFLVTNLGDHHLYDWFFTSQNQLAGIDLGPWWTTVGFITKGNFIDVSRPHDPTRPATKFTNFLVNNFADSHLYDWFINPNNYQLTGIDLGPVWNNISLVTKGNFTSRGSGPDNLIVTNTVDHHLYDWWIDPAFHNLQGVDLGPWWNNVAFLTTGNFDTSHTALAEMLVTNVTDNHMYEWWVTAQGQLAGIDLGPVWGPNLQLVDTQIFNTLPDGSSPSELLVRNNADGHFYEWWIHNGLQGIDLGLAQPTGMAANSNALLIQAMASFSVNGPSDTSATTPVNVEPHQAQLSLAAPLHA